VSEKAGKVRRTLDRLSIRWQLALTYLLIIWLTIGVLVLFVGRAFQTSTIDARRSALFAQAHLLASAVRARGGPATARLTALGGVPFHGRVLLLDGNGRVLEDSAADPEFYGKVISGPEVRSALSGKEASNTYYLPDGTFVMYVAVPADWGGTSAIGAGGAVFISQDLSDIVAQYRSIMGMTLAGGGVASLLVLAVAWGFSGVLSAPLSEMAKAARKMASGRLDARVEPRGPFEARSLGESFNSMAQAVEKMVHSQEDFLMAAAHEFRSPLASMAVLLESMEINPPEKAELLGLLSDLRQEVQHLSKVSESILGLLRVRNAEYPLEEVDVESVILDALRAREPLILAKDLRVSVRGTAGTSGAPETFKTNRPLFELIVSNLVDNAVKFTPRNGKVEIRFGREKGESGDFILEVEDNGPGIPPEHIPAIFQRFYRVDSSRSKKQGGAGLGLSIVKEACDRMGGTTEVKSEPGKGTTFTIRFS